MSKNTFQGNRLRLARTFNGITLAELGRQISVTRQYMQRLEINTGVTPSEDILFALAEILHVGPSFFFSPLTEEVREDHIHFRRLQSASLAVRNRVLSYGTLFNMIVTYLETKLDLPEVTFPNISINNEEDIELAAEECRKLWGLSIGPIDNMTRVLEYAGAVVSTYDGISDKVDALTLHGNRPIILRSIDKDSTSRARFDLAHECGHLVIHQGIETGDSMTEAEAHRFASAFLLPRVPFTNEFPIGKSISWRALINMKRRWGVSLQAMIRRAFDLGIISAVQYRNANVYISRMGWKKNEPAEPKAELSETIPNSLKILYDDRGLSALDIAREMHLSISIFEELGIVEKSKVPREKAPVISLDDFRSNPKKGR